VINPGTPLPAFTTSACITLDEGHELATISSSDFPGKWLVLYTYPKDFTFVCPTEILEFDRHSASFDRRGAVLLGGSTDNEHSHLAWRKSHPLLGKIRHSLIFISPQISSSLGILHPAAGVALRATIIVDPQGLVRFASANDLDVGRNVDEVLRVLDALQTGALTACNWRPGEPTLG
jgi:peroxiredoxin (alkyl hydroperoxide reductase subunit C)